MCKGNYLHVLLDSSFIMSSFTDPHHRSRYLRSNSFLAMLDGDRSHRNIKGKDLLPERLGMIRLCF